MSPLLVVKIVGRLEAQVFSFSSDECVEVFLRSREQIFYRDRVKQKLSTEIKIDQKFYEGNGEVVAKLLEDPATWSLGRFLCQQILSVAEPQYGKDFVINPLGPSPMKDREQWVWNRHDMPDGETIATDIDRFLFIKKGHQHVSIHCCQVYAPTQVQKLNINRIKKKNNQLPDCSFFFGQTAPKEIVVFLNSDFHQTELPTEMGGVVEGLGQNLRPNTFLSFVYWSTPRVYVARCPLVPPPNLLDSGSFSSLGGK